MKVAIKELSVNMALGSKGIELEVYSNDDKHLGDLVIGKAKVEWCQGRTHVGNGVKKDWSELIEFFKGE